MTDMVPFDREGAQQPDLPSEMSRSARARWRQARALELALRGSSYDEIADTLGYSGRGAAWKAVQSGLSQDTIQAAREYRALELARLDALQAANWEQALGGSVKAAALVLRVIAQRIRLLGLEDLAEEGPHGHATIVVGGTSEEYIAALRSISDRSS